MDSKHVCFWLRDQQLGASIADVKETIVMRPITRVFLTPPWIAGIINLRGDVVAVIDLAAFLELGRTTPSAETRIVITHCGGVTAGLLVDRLSEVRVIDPARVQPPPPTIAPEVAELCTGVTTIDDGTPLLLLDLPRLLGSPRLRPSQERLTA
jgi:purine-binding chemotaxis protein CheW